MSLTKMKVVDPFKVNTLVDKSNFASHLNGELEVTTPTQFSGVTRDVVPVDFGQLREFRFTEVAPGTTVPSHAHRSPIFRIITDGEAIVNGKSYKKGDWMVIPAGTDYVITTPIGYTAAWVCVFCW